MFGHRGHHCAGREGHRHQGGRGGFFGGSFGGGGRGAGPGMRTARMLASGDLQIVVLLLLSDKPRHGYEIIKAFEERSSGVYTPSPGMVYPALTYLEGMGYAVAAADGAKKLYSITADGSEHLSKHRAAASEVWNQLASFGRKLAHFQKQFAQDEDVADHFGSGAGSGAGSGSGSGSGSDAKGESQRMKAEFRGLRDELKAALYEKIDASMEEKRRVLEVLRRAIAEIRGS